MQIILSPISGQTFKLKIAHCESVIPDELDLVPETNYISENFLAFFIKNEVTMFYLKNKIWSKIGNRQVVYLNKIFQFSAHKKLKEFDNKRSRQCQFCQKTFSESSKYFKHANNCHPLEVSCHICMN